MENETFQQDRNQNVESDLVFAMQLLMKEKCKVPDRETAIAVMKKHLGDDLDFSDDKRNSIIFSVNQYKMTYETGTIAPILMITDCCKTDHEKIDAFIRSQMWACPEHEQILSQCNYQVVAVDMLAGMMDYRDRAEMLMNYMEALVELYPTCEAVYMKNSGKMFAADKIRNHTIPKEDRFVYFAVNVRFFNIQGTDDMIVDTLGMHMLSLPDLQYHFHAVDPNAVVNHAYNVLSYLFANGNLIQENDTIDGMMGEQWHCHYEDALIQPVREVIDIDMNAFASGNRENME